MTDYSEIAEQLTTKLRDLSDRAGVIADKFLDPMKADLDDQAVQIELRDSLAGVDEVLVDEIEQTRMALARIDNGSYGYCSVCGEEISMDRLKAMPTATRCIKDA